MKAIRWENESITNWGICDDCGKCAEVCYAGAREMIGSIVSVSQLMVEIKRDIPFFDQSGGGVTFTGGEPMFQREFLWESLLACKEQGIHTIVDTSGYTSWEGFEQIISCVDIFLYDLKLMDETRHKQYTSVSNLMILDNLKKLSRARASIIVRIPLIPGVNDDEENIIQSASFLSTLPHLLGVELMPYHEIGLAKYQGLGMNYRFNQLKPISLQHIQEVEQIIYNYHLPILKDSPGRII